MDAERLVILRQAVAEDGLVHLRFGDGVLHTIDHHELVVAELVAYGYLHPLPEAADDPEAITYRVTEEGRSAVARQPLP